MTTEQVNLFYQRCVFGTEDNKTIAAAKRAYRDLCRTIKFQNKDQEKKTHAYNQALGELEIIGSYMKSDIVFNREMYDDLHRTLCNTIITLYKHDNVANLSYGQAQKWVNMTMKYLCVLMHNEENVWLNSVYDHLHVPIDNIVLEQATISFPNHFPNRPKTCWSNFDKETYIEIQTKFREAITTAPMDWEFEIWNNAK